MYRDDLKSLSFFVNTGMYIIESDNIGYISKDAFFHKTNLAQVLFDKDIRVGAYPISEEAFLDMGELEEMKRMEDKLEENDPWR